MRADHVAVRRARHRTDHRSAFARAGCAPGDREFELGTRCRVRRNANMINPIGTVIATNPETATARLDRRAWSPTIKSAAVAAETAV